MAAKPLFIFVDESGDFNFSPSGTKYYIFTCVITYVPSEKVDELNELRHRILSKETLNGLNDAYLENNLAYRFHATEDIQVVRDEVFKLIGTMGYFKAHGIVVPKNKTNHSIRAPLKFYPKTLSSLLDYVFKIYKYTNLVIFVDGNPVNAQKTAFIKAIKSYIAQKSPKTPYSIHCPPSSTNYFLQIADYINWAIYRKWNSGDLRSYNLISKFLGAPEKDIYARGTTEYYQFKTKK